MKRISLHVWIDADDDSSTEDIVTTAESSFASIIAKGVREVHSRVIGVGTNLPELHEWPVVLGTHPTGAVVQDVD